MKKALIIILGLMICYVSADETLKPAGAARLGRNVFSKVGVSASEWKGLKGTAKRSRRVNLDPGFIAGKRHLKLETVSLDLFDDVCIEGIIRDSIVSGSGTVVSTAQINGSDWGRVFIAETAGRIRAKITFPELGTVYAVQYNPADGSHYALEVDPDSEKRTVHLPPMQHPSALKEAPVLLKRLPPIAAKPLDEAAAAVVVDVMVVYSDDALADAGSATEVSNLIALGMAFANDAHTNSDTGVILNLVHSQQVAYTDTGNLSTDLDRLGVDGDTFIDNVHALRDTHGADLVCMMVGDYGGNGGMGYILQTTLGQQLTGFSVVNLPLFESYTPAHEMGHNMGLDHAKDHLPGFSPGPTAWFVDGYGFGDTSAGWHWHPTALQPGFCTVMTYTFGSAFADNLSHTAVGLFSDPNLSHRGMAAGDAADGFNAQVIRTLRNIYAAYRNRPIPANSIQIDYPKGSEILISGLEERILWDMSGVSGNVKIELLKGGAVVNTVDADALNDRVYSWFVPDGMSGDDFKIKITSINEPGISGQSSADFSIRHSLYSEPLDSNPGYTATGDWAFGAPSGDNPTWGGAVDAYSGTDIYDTNLSGASFGTYYLTTIPIDCSGFQSVYVTFMSWFSVSVDYTALVQVSNNGTDWSDLYSVTDKWCMGWSRMTFDISSIADGENTVYMRWVHRQDAAGANFSGMSVDDIRVAGEAVAPPDISISDASLTEGDSGSAQMTFTVSLSTTVGYTVEVDYATAPDSADTGVDYTAVSGTLTFIAGQSSKPVTVDIIGETDRENDEQFFMDLSDPYMGTITDAQGIGTITDNDFLLTVQDDGNGTVTPVSPVTVSGGTPTAITASPDGGYAFVTWSLISGAAVFGDAGSDNTTVSITEDTVVQADFIDVSVDIQLNVGSMNVSEGGTNTFDVTLSALPPGTVDVLVSRSSGDTDITVNGGPVLTLNFDSGNWSTPQTVTLSAAEDGDTSNDSAVISLTSADATNTSLTVDEIDNDSAGPDPVAVMTADVLSGAAPLTVTFGGSSSFDPDGTILDWDWDYNNDGSFDEGGVNVSHVFWAGTHTVILRVTDNDSLTATDSVVITVSGAAGPPKKDESSGCAYTETNSDYLIILLLLTVLAGYGLRRAKSLTGSQD